MATKHNLLNKLIIGTEKDEDYVKNSLPTSRWELFWDIIKGNVFKLVGINVLVLLTFLPMIALFIIKGAYLSTLGQLEGFSQGFGVGYPAVPDFTGVPATLALSANARYLTLLPVCMAIGALGLAGGAFVMRNFAWGEGVFIASDFIRGIRRNYLRVLLISVLYSIMLVLLLILNSYATVLKITAPSLNWMFAITQIFAWFFIIFFTIMALYMVTMTVTYELKFFALLKNAFLFTVALIPLNTIILLGALIPFVPMLFGGIISLVGIFIIAVFAVSFALLAWSVYSQWVFDKHINVALEKKYRNRGLYEKQSVINKEELEKYKRQKQIVSDLTSRPIKPIDDDIVIEELPTSFSRADIARLNEQKEVMRKDNEEYVKAHYDDERYREARRILAEQQDGVSDEENERLLEITRLELEGKKIPKQPKNKYVNPKKKKKK